MKNKQIIIIETNLRIYSFTDNLRKCANVNYHKTLRLKTVCTSYQRHTKTILYKIEDISVFSSLSWCRYQMDAFYGRYDKILIENENLL